MELAEDELRNFILVWISAVVSLAYCYAVARTTPAGVARFLLILPVICLFLLLPLRLTTIHLTGTTAFFLSWLSNFKLLLFTAGLGPLSSHLSLCNFIAFACLPIKSKHHPSPHKSQIHNIPLLSYLTKATLLAIFIKIYDYSDQIQLTLLRVIYFFHMYFMLELMLAVVAAIAKLYLGLELELEPQFNEPLLSSSLQDFWGKRWNLMVTGILRPTVYEPVWRVSTRLVDRRKAALAAVFATFVVSGAMHELIFYYLGRAAPTFEVSAFFVLHGACLCGEIVAKRAVGGAWTPPRVVSAAATSAFVIGTGLWLFLPPMLRFRTDERAFEEYAAVGAFVRKVSRAVMGPTGI